MLISTKTTHAMLLPNSTDITVTQQWRNLPPATADPRELAMTSCDPEIG